MAKAQDNISGAGEKNVFQRAAIDAVIDAARAYALLEIHGINISDGGNAIHVHPSNMSAQIEMAKELLLKKSKELLLEDTLLGRHFSDTNK